MPITVAKMDIKKIKTTTTHMLPARDSLQIDIYRVKG